MKFKNLDRYRTGGTGSKMQLSVPLPQTPKSRVYRLSPNEAAHPRHFVIGNREDCFEAPAECRDRMKLEPGSKQTVCPYSGDIADDDDFLHPEDRKAALDTVKHELLADVHEHLAKAFRGIGRSQSRNSFVKLEVKTKKYSKPKPRFSRRDLMRELVCDHCGRDYAVFAIGLFCPDCGAPNLRLHFAREVELVEAQVDLADGLGADQEELAYRLLGNAHEDVLTAFEATLKTVYLYGMAQRPADSPAFKPVKNDFQNIDFAQKRYEALEFDPFAGLDDAALGFLRLNIQKRHVIGHNLGVVDEKFAEHAKDARLGETVHLVGEDIRRFAALAQMVVDQLDGWLGGAPSPTIGEKMAVPEPTDRKDAPSESSSPLDELDCDLSPLARRVGLWLAEQSPDGMEGLHSGSSVEEVFPTEAKRDLADAIAELDADGFVRTSSDLSRDLPYLRLQLDLFATFDPIAFGTDPAADAAELIRVILDGEDSVSVPKLYEKIGWPLRRFNPALGYVIALIDDRHFSKEIISEHPTRWFSVDTADRVALRRFLKRSEG